MAGPTRQKRQSGKCVSWLASVRRDARVSPTRALPNQSPTTTFVPTVAATPRASLANPATAEGRDTSSIAPDPISSDPR